MARISSYDQDSSLNVADKLLGTDSTTGATKNFTLDSVVTLVNDTGLVQAFDGSTFQFTDYVAPGSTPQGILNLNEGTATTTAFSAINQIFISVKDTSGLSLAEYLDNTANDFIKISKKDNLNNFGIFEVTAIQTTGSGQYRKLTVTPRGTNGNLTAGVKYFVANYSALYDQDFSDDAITEFGDVANTFFTGSTASQLTAAGSGSIITTAERTSLTNFTNNGLIHGDVVNNLVTNTTDVPLSANQGLVLKGLIDGINTLLTSNDTNLDTIQEVVDFIKTNKSTLDSLGISNISGLQAALDAKEPSVTGKGLSANDFTDALLTKLNGIAANAEVNIAHDYTTLSNKPTDVTNLGIHDVTELQDVTSTGSGAIISSAERNLITSTHATFIGFSTAERTKLAGIDVNTSTNVITDGTDSITIPTNTNTTYDLSVHDSGDDAIIRLTGSDSTTDNVTLEAGNNITLTPNSGTLTIAASLTTAAVANGSTSLVTGDHVFDYADPKFARKDQAEVFANNVTITGDLIVSGTTTTINTANLTIEDNIMILNSGQTGTPAASLRSGIEIERGDVANVKLQFNENTDKWEFTNDGSTFYQLAINIGDLASAKLELDHDLIIDSKIVTKHSNTVKTMAVTVVTKTAAHPAHGVGSTLGYSIDGIESPELTFAVGNTYKFDQSDSSNGGHPLVFYYEEARSTAYSTGVTTVGTPGQSGAYTQIIPTESTPTVLYYQCSAHANMGWKSVFNTRNLTGFTTDNLTEGIMYTYYSDSKVNTRIAATSIGLLSDVDITTSAPSSGQALVWDGSKFEPGAVGSTLTVKDESTTLNTSATTLKFAGSGVTASGTGAEKTITIPGGTSGITVQEEGSDLSTAATTLNFTGSAVTASGSGAVKTINITGGSSSSGTVTIEKNVYTGDGSDVTFDTTTAIANENNVQVYIDGVYQSKDNYTTSGSTVTFGTGNAPPNGASVELIHMVSTSGVIARDSFTGNGSDTVYVLSMSISNENATQVYLDGVYQSKNNYSTSGSTLTFSTAPPNGTAIEVVHIKAVAASALNQNNFTGNGSAQNFALSQTIDDTAKTFVFIQGVYQEKSTYSISGTTLTFSTPPQNGYTIEVMAFDTISVGNATVSATSWQSAIKTSNFTAEKGKGYFVNTSGGAVTVTLPLSPSLGDIVEVSDYGGSSATNNITFTSSNNIQGGSGNKVLATNNGSIKLVYSDSTKGWVAAADSTDALENPAINITYLVVAGGGAAGTSGGRAGGGGAGGFRTGTLSAVSIGTSYTVTVGAGGTGTDGNVQGGDGVNSLFGSITSTGGGGGGGHYNNSTTNGRPGGSGGGGATLSGSYSSGGAGNAGGYTPVEGYAGGGGGYSGSVYGSGGGGGAGGAGAQGNYSTGNGGNGGIGATTTMITTTEAGTLSIGQVDSGNVYFAGGGGGGVEGGNNVAGTGGLGGGTAGNTASNSSPANTGGGSGGWGGTSNGNGGSGVVLLKYPNSATITVPGGLAAQTITSGSDKITAFKSGTGTITFN